NEMQKFLDEVARMRERAEQKKQEATAAWSPAVERPEPAVAVRWTPARPQPRSRPVVSIAEPQPMLEVLPVIEAVERAPAAKISVAAEVRRGVSPAARQTLALLRSPQSLATAWLLKEVFDRPMCMHERRT